jgi:hypothetical protein
LPESGWQNKVAGVKRELRGKFNITSLVSLALAIFTLLLWLATFWINPWDQRISFTKSFHVGVWDGFGGDTLGRLVFFNNAEYGPYRGSIMGIGGEGTKETRWGWHTENYDFGQIIFTNQNGTVDRLRLCDLPGIYFRDIENHSYNRPLWTLMVSLWYPLFLFSVLPVWWIFHRWCSRRSQPSSA